MQLIMKNFEIKPFGEFLYELTLKGKDSRMRSRFVSIIEEQLSLISKERDILIQDFGKKDSEGNVVTEKDENGNHFAVLEDKISFNIEVSKLMSEDFIIEVTPKNEEMIKSIYSAVLDCDKEFSGVEAERYSRFCEIMEQFSF